MTKPVEENLQGCCQFERLKALEFCTHVVVHLCIVVIASKLKPKLEGSRQALPDVLESMLEAFDVVKDFLNVSFAPLLC